MHGLAATSAFTCGGKPFPMENRSKSRLWTAWLDRHSPPHNLSRIYRTIFRSLARQEICTTKPRRGPVPFSAIGRRIVVRVRGSHLRGSRSLETISPDGKWLVAETPISGEDTVRGVQAFNVDDGKMKHICYSLCAVRRSENGKFLFVGLPNNSSSAGTFRTFIVPQRRGSVFPDLPVNVIGSEADLETITGVRMVEQILHPGRDDSRCAFDRNSDHRNIYRIPIPN